jgi:hypothetical protein
MKITPILLIIHSRLLTNETEAIHEEKWVHNPPPGLILIIIDEIMRNAFKRMRSRIR